MKMTLEEFLKHVYHTRLCVVIPSLNRAKVYKSDFFVKGKLNESLLEEHLVRIYNESNL